MSRPLIQKFVSFAGVGAIATGVQYLILIVLAELGMLAALASGIGYAISSMLNYYLNYRYTFKSTKRHRDTLLRFFAVALVGLGLNTLVMIIAVEYLHLHYMIAQILATCLVLLWNFGANAIWTF